MNGLDDTNKDKVAPPKGGISAPPTPGAYISEGSELTEKIHREVLNVSPSGQMVLEMEALKREAFKEMSLDEVARTLSTSIVKDDANKRILFLCFLLNYTEEDQQNIGFNAPSSTGKSYLAIEIAKYFPTEDVEVFAYNSPRAFFHEMSELTTLTGEPLAQLSQYIEDGLKEWEEANPKPSKGEGLKDWRDSRRSEYRRLRNQWDAIEKVYRVNLERKILIFLDQPHDELLKVLRSLLSHDKKILPVKIVDKTKEGGNRTKTIWLIGFPTVVFNSANFSLNEQERTRFWLLSPEMSQEKLRASLSLQSQVLSDRDGFKEELERDKARRVLSSRILAIKEAGVREVLIREEDRAFILSEFMGKHPNLAPRHQRDFPRVVALIKAHALINCLNRERTEDSKGIWATRRDVEEGFRLVENVIASSELGLPPHVYKFWVEALSLKLSESMGLLRMEVSGLYYQFYRHRIGERTVRNMIKLLEEAGLVSEEPDPNDRRQRRIYAPGVGGAEIPPSKGQEKASTSLDSYSGAPGEVGQASQPTLNEGEAQPTKETSESTPPQDNLRENLVFLVEVLRELEARKGDAVRTEDLYERIRSKRLWFPTTFKEILKLAERDQVIFSPRPGYWRSTP